MASLRIQRGGIHKWKPQQIRLAQPPHPRSHIAIDSPRTEAEPGYRRVIGGALTKQPWLRCGSAAETASNCGCR
jgi:hypothetical protein